MSINREETVSNALRRIAKNIMEEEKSKSSQSCPSCPNHEDCATQRAATRIFNLNNDLLKIRAIPEAELKTPAVYPRRTIP
jgi:hypothetical protein